MRLFIFLLLAVLPASSQYVELSWTHNRAFSVLDTQRWYWSSRLLQHIRQLISQKCHVALTTSKHYTLYETTSHPGTRNNMADRKQSHWRCSDWTVIKLNKLAKGGGTKEKMTHVIQLLQIIYRFSFYNTTCVFCVCMLLGVEGDYRLGGHTCTTHSAAATVVCLQRVCRWHVVCLSVVFSALILLSAFFPAVPPPPPPLPAL